MNARPISWPTVPKGMDRIRICLHSNHTKEDIDKLVDQIASWARSVATEKYRGRRIDGKQEKERATTVLLEAKL